MPFRFFPLYVPQVYPLTTEEPHYRQPDVSTHRTLTLRTPFRRFSVNITLTFITSTVCLLDAAYNPLYLGHGSSLLRVDGFVRYTSVFRSTSMYLRLPASRTGIQPPQEGNWRSGDVTMSRRLVWLKSRRNADPFKRIGGVDGACS